MNLHEFAYNDDPLRLGEEEERAVQWTYWWSQTSRGEVPSRMNELNLELNTVSGTVHCTVRVDSLPHRKWK